MRVSGPIPVVTVFCLSVFSLASLANAQSDQGMAQSVMGPQWKQLSRRAGMIFAGTVLQTEPARTRAATVTSPSPGAFPAVQLTFRVDLAVAGVETGQILTIHEWAGAWSMHRPMLSGQRILMFLYPPSRLGLTSPVGGPLGQINLDASGNYIAQHEFKLAQSRASPGSSVPTHAGNVSVAQLARAIRRARSE